MCAKADLLSSYIDEQMWNDALGLYVDRMPDNQPARVGGEAVSMIYEPSFTSIFIESEGSFQLKIQRNGGIEEYVEDKSWMKKET